MINFSSNLCHKNCFSIYFPSIKLWIFLVTFLWLLKGKSSKKKATKKASKKSTKVPGKKKPTADEVQRAFTTFKTKNCKKTTARAMLSYSQFLSLIEGKKQQIWFFLVETIVEIGIEDVFQPWIVVVPFKFWIYSAQLPFDIVKF